MVEYLKLKQQVLRAQKLVNTRRLDRLTEMKDMENRLMKYCFSFCGLVSAVLLGVLRLYS